jgi:hypothetical protein
VIQGREGTHCDGSKQQGAIGHNEKEPQGPAAEDGEEQRPAAVEEENDTRAEAARQSDNVEVPFRSDDGARVAASEPRAFYQFQCERRGGKVSWN